MQPVKVLHIGLTDSFGGIESFLLNQNRLLASDGFIFNYVAYGEKVAREKDFLDCDASIYHLSNRCNLRTYYQELKQIIGKGYDIIHIHKNSAIDFLPFICAHYCSSAHIISHAHNTGTIASARLAILNRVGRHVISATSNLKLACSSIAAEYVYGSARDTQFMPNGIDFSKFHYSKESRCELRKALSVDDKLVIGCVGAFRTAKNQQFLAPVIERLLEKGIDAHILFLGDGRYMRDVQLLFNANGLEPRATFLGNVTNVNEYMSAMDVLVMPSLYEGLPLTAIEAQVSGLPVIVSDTVTTEIDRTPLVMRCSIKNNDYDAWANCIIKSLAFRVTDDSQLGLLCEFEMHNTSKLLSDAYRALLS